MSYHIKIVTTGPVGAGKTSIVARYFLNQFSYDQDSTIGASYVSKIIKGGDKSISLDKSDSGDIILELWDTAGQERYRSLLPLYYRNSDVVLLVFNVYGNGGGIDELVGGGWITEIHKIFTGKEMPVIFLVGNKMDIGGDLSMSQENHLRQIAENNGAILHLTSAKSGVGIHTLFQRIIKKCREEDRFHHKTPTINSINSINMNIERRERGKWDKCCSVM